MGTTFDNTIGKIGDSISESLSSTATDKKAQMLAASPPSGKQQATRQFATKAPTVQSGRSNFRNIDPRSYNQVQRGVDVASLEGLLNQSNANIMSGKAKQGVYSRIFGSRGLL